MKKLLPLPPLLLLFIFGLFAPWSCKKENKGGLISGHVFEYGTNLPIAGAIVRLYSGDGDVGGNEALTLLDTTSTNQEGAYRFENVPSGGWFEVTAVKQSYFVPNEPIYLNDNEETADFYLFPFAWLKVHIINVPPANTWDWITTYFDYGRNFYGATDSIIVKRVEGNRVINLQYIVRESGTQTVFDTSLYLPGFDTINYEIIY